MSTHEWEAPRHAWEREPEIWDESWYHEGGDRHCDPTSFTPAEKAEEFADMLAHLKYNNKLSAKDVCILAWWATEAGPALSSGKAAEIAFKPYKSSGHYSRHLDAVMTPVSGKYFNLSPMDVPAYNKYDGTRSVERMHMVAAHEVLAEEVAQNPDLHCKLKTMQDEDKLPPMYYNSPVVEKQGKKTFPVAIYLDGIAFAKRDGVLGIFMYNMAGGPNCRRHLIAALRKSQMCRCGCRNYCTLFHAFLYIKWCIEAMADAVNPLTRHDGSPFWPEEVDRIAIAGTVMVAAFAVVLVKGDWAEFGPTLGFPTFTSNYHPCPLCRASKEDLVLLDGFSAVDFPFAAKTYEELKTACDRAEVHLVIDKQSHRAIRTRLRYDRKDKGCHGRCLVEDVPVLGLKAGDRLEPSVALPDIGRQFDNLTLFPFPVTFWRSSEQTWVYHRLPLWSERAGFTHDLAMGVDWLHTLSLGVYQFCFALLYTSNVSIGFVEYSGVH